MTIGLSPRRGLGGMFMKSAAERMGGRLVIVFAFHQIADGSDGFWHYPVFGCSLRNNTFDASDAFPRPRPCARAGIRRERRTHQNHQQIVF
jgi:hypothetical protein